MHFRYAAFGLTIESGLELPELGQEIELEGEADLTIRLGKVARYGTDGGGERDRVRWVDEHNFWLHADPVAHYLVSGGREITVMPEAGADAAEVRGYLLGSACGAMLVQRGMLVLHGNAIRIGDACMVCVGDSGAGKSTLAAGFLKRGYQVLADDVVAVDDGNCAIPGFARIKLWQDAADQLGCSTEGRQRVSRDMDKFNLPIEPFDREARLPIRWIYQLTADEVDDVHIDPITGLRRFRLLRDNTYRNEYLEGEALLAGHLHRCSRLAQAASLSTVVRPREGFELDRLIDRLLEDVSATGKSARASLTGSFRDS